MDFYDNNEDILNSSLYSTSEDSEEKAKYDNEVFNNSNLKYGIIVDCFDIDDDKNITKLAPEYNVMVIEQKQQEGVEPKLYTHCISIDGFGGVSDFFEHKLRPVNKKEGKEEAKLDIDFSKQFGNIVLILCLDGSTDKGIIVKSLPHPGRKTNLTKENGLHMEGEYNGLNWKVDKDGALTVTFKSATDNEGKPIDEKTGGTFVNIDKTGSVDINTNDGTNIKLDKANKDIIANAGNNVTIKSVKDTTIEATGKATIKSTADLIMDSGASAKISSKSAMNIEAKGELEVKGAKIKLQSEGKLDLKGKIVAIDAPLIQLGKGGLPAVTAMTKFLGTGFAGVPVLCSAVGPFSSAVFVKS